MKLNFKMILSFIAIILGFFMALLDATIVNIALPKMTEYYGASMQHITWVVNGYNLAFAVFIITASRIADQFGRKKIFIIGIFAFTLSSFLSGISTSVDMLIFFRVIQGLSAAIVVPVTVPLITELVPKEKHGMVLGIWGAISGLAAASGPTLGGILTENFNWQSIFFVNIPIGVVTLIMTAILVKNSFDTTATRKIDWGGMITISGAMFALTYALIQANDKGWTSPFIIGLFVLSIVLLVAFFIIESKTKDPMLPMWLLKVPTFSASSLTLLIFGVGVMGATFLMSFFLNTVMGKSVLQAGIIISAMPLSSMVFSSISGPLSGKLGSRIFAIAGMVLLGAAMLLFSQLTPDSSQFDIVWRLAVCGAGLGFTMAPIMGAVMRNVPREKIGIASGVTNMSRALGTVLGVAILVMILNSNMSDQIVKAKTNALEIVKSDSILDPKLKDGISEGLNSIKASRESKMPGSDNILEIVNKQESDALSKAPEQAKPKIRAGFTIQKNEVEKIWPKIEKSVKNDITSAFSTTFKFGSLLMIIGVLIAFFCDNKKSDSKQPAESHVVFE